MGTIALQAMKGIDKWRLSRSGAPTYTKVKLLWIVLDLVFHQLKFFVGNTSGWIPFSR